MSQEKWKKFEPKTRLGNGQQVFEVQSVTQKSAGGGMETEYRHPAFGMISVHRFHGSVKDRLFQSNINTHTGITITISLADLKRDLSNDWVHPYQELVEVHLSPAQWHQLLTEMNTVGVPCTIGCYFDPDGRFMRPAFPEDFDNELKRLAREFDAAIKKLEVLSPEATETLKVLAAKMSKKDAEKLMGVIDGLTSTLKSHIPFIRRMAEESVGRLVEHAKAEVASFTDVALKQKGLQHLAGEAPSLPDSALPTLGHSLHLPED